MKLVTVQFPEATDIDIIPKGTEGIAISDGTNSISGGRIMALVDITDPEFVPPTEPVVVTIGPVVEP